MSKSTRRHLIAVYAAVAIAAFLAGLACSVGISLAIARYT
jgi:hypothetical protein